MKKILIAAFALLSSLTTRAQMVAVNTDVLMDVLQMPSVGAELVIGERSTIGFKCLRDISSMG